METEQFYNFFLPELQKHGYEGIFSAKSRARTMSEDESKKVDGCAIFFKTTRYVMTCYGYHKNCAYRWFLISIIQLMSLDIF